MRFAPFIVIVLLSLATVRPASAVPSLTPDTKAQSIVTEAGVRCGPGAHYVRGHRAPNGAWVPGHCVPNR